MLNFLREGATTDRIAAELFITEGTVRSHVSSLLAKLGVEKRQDVAAWFQARAQ
ncbi:MAG: helix-turn-helix transcriptional regulator [Actinomycetia bacterium]|nr:helix-turn-helix transcriptional regulator [Actinomycetes bacterium]